MRIGVFGYGSLVNITSLAATLGREPEDVHYVTLKGWIRDWSVRCKNDSPKGRFEILEDQAVPEHVLALNIQKAIDKTEQALVNGIVFSVTDTDIVSLDMRERHYERVEVTEQIVGEHPFDIVYTYTGKEADLVAEKDVAIIPASYVAVVEEGFSHIDTGAHAVYLQSTMPSSFNVVSTQFRIL